jgi:hypothetical protein
MPSFSMPRGSWLLLIAVCLILLPGKAEAFGAGNIPSIAQVSYKSPVQTTWDLLLKRA